MAKECFCCNKKIGLLSGSYFDGEMCDLCYQRFGGYRVALVEGKNDINEYIEQYTNIKKIIDKQPESESIKERAKKLFYECIDNKYKMVSGESFEIALQKKNQAEKKEENRINYANSFNEFYEYDVETVINANHGTVDKEKMKEILSSYSRKGYRLHTIYSNELGKNALSLLGFGVNSTASEDVMIFERRIQNLD